MVSACKHNDIKKALVRGTIGYLESQGLPVNKTAIFKHFDLTRSQGRGAINTPSSLRNDPEWEERRGRPTKLSDQDQQKMEGILWGDAFENESLNWKELAKRASLDVDVANRTMHRTMGTLGYRRCIHCGTSRVNIKAREKRVEWARKMLESMPNAEDWRNVRFSYELHFGFGLDGSMRILPRIGEKLCPPCETAPEVDKWSRDVRRLHAWAAVGHNFKSDLVFYDESTNAHSTGQMSMADYKDKILLKVVKTWLEPEDGDGDGDGVVESDGDGDGCGNLQSLVLQEDLEIFAHGGLSKVNPVQEWKYAVGLQHHFNCGDCPDLSPLDSLWPVGKQWKMDEPPREWDETTLRQTAKKAWKEMFFSQDEVNMWVDFMPVRLEQVMKLEGRMVKF